MNRTALALLTLLLTATAAAQEAPPTTSTSGTLQSMRGNVLHVVSAQGDQYWIKLPERPQAVSYSGTADPSFLKPGMLVRFSGRFDKKGNMPEPLGRLEIFTPATPGRNQQVAEEDRLGVFPSAGLASRELFADIDDKKPAEELTGYRVAGRVTGARSGKLQVATGTNVVQVEVANDAQIAVEVNDWRLMQVGDKVAADGWYNPMQPTQLFATRLAITGSQPLGTKAKPRGETPAKSPAAKY